MAPPVSLSGAGGAPGDHGDRPGRGLARIRRRRVPACCGRSGEHRADYAYVLPAIVVMLVVIAYPIYYTIELVVLQNAAGPAAAATRSSSASTTTGPSSPASVFWQVTWNTVIWTVASTLFSFVLGFAVGAGAAPRVRRPRRAAGDPHHPLGDQRGRRLLHLEVALPLRFRRHRRACSVGSASPTGRRTSSTTSAPSCRR